MPVLIKNCCVRQKPLALVLGAGISGLAMSIRLAIKGYRVEVWEKNSFAGGKLSEYKLGPYRFDAGPSLFTLPNLVEELYQLAGKSKEMLAYERLDPICRYFWEDGTRFDAPADPDQFAEDAAKAFGVSKAAVRKQLQRSKDIYDTTAPVFLFRSMHKAHTFLSKDFLKGVVRFPQLQVFKSMHQAHASRLNHPKLVQLFDRYATYNGSSPYKAPATLQAIPSLEYFQGAWLPKDGMIAITQGLEALAKSLGVQFKFGQTVTQIHHREGLIRKICTQETEAEPHLTVSAIDVAALYPLLSPKLALPRRIEKADRSTSALVFNWGIEDEFPELDLHNIFFSEDYQKEFHQLENQSGPPDDPTIYLFISSKKVEGDAPQGHENWFTMINLPGDKTLSKKEQEQARKIIIQKLERILNRPVESKIRAEWILNPQGIADRTGSPDGALYGSASNQRMAAFNRHPNFLRRFKNLYFTGGSVHPGGGIPLCLNSAAIAANEIPDA